MKKDGVHYRTIWPVENMTAVEIIDQTALPHHFVVAKIDKLITMVSAIKTMQVRGAPLIGAAAAYGMALAALHDKSQAQSGSDAYLKQCADMLLDSRPTAVNLRWAVQRMLERLLPLPYPQRNAAAWREAAAICDEDVAMNHAIGQHGLQLIQSLIVNKSTASKSAAHKHTANTITVNNIGTHNDDSRQQFAEPVNFQQPVGPTPTHPFNILTHCNAGWLAAVDWGTALAPVYAAHEAGIAVHVWVDETRPRNQGASLTAWELGQHGIPHTVITDNAGGHFMQHGQVDMVIVGADRVTRTGDVCNKIGTYLKALAAHDNNIPFYAAVPSPTIDWTIADGNKDIHIEDRSPDEVRIMTGRLMRDNLESHEIASVSLLPANSQVANPAFDVTPARLVTGIITERGLSAPGHLHRLFDRPASAA